MAGNSLLPLIVACCQLLALAAAGEEGELCQTPDARSGTCTPILQCPELKELLATMRRTRDNASFRFLRDSHCGTFKKKETIVCCAFANATAGDANRPPIAGIPNRVQSGGGADVDEDEVFDEDMEVDVTNHANVGSVNNQCGESEGSRIFGGTEAEMNEFPWMAVLMYRTKQNKTSFSCGGALINKRYVLTAAHCVKDTSKAGTLFGVRLGEHDTRSAEDCEENPVYGRFCAPATQNFGVEALFPHPRYNRFRLVNDIALIRLDADVDLTTEQVQPVCLPVGVAQQFMDFGSTNLTVAGWGAIENGSLSSVLMKARVPGVDLKTCQDIYRRHNLTVLASHMCAGGAAIRQDSCKGDSGGPLKTFFGRQIYQIGVVSYGPSRCGSVGYPGVYARVGRYMKWILDTVKL